MFTNRARRACRGSCSERIWRRGPKRARKGSHSDPDAVHSGHSQRLAYRLRRPLPGGREVLTLQPTEFLRELRRAVGVPFGIPRAAWILEIAALILRTDTELLLKSRPWRRGDCSPRDFAFSFPDTPADLRVG